MSTPSASAAAPEITSIQDMALDDEPNPILIVAPNRRHAVIGFWLGCLGSRSGVSIPGFQGPSTTLGHVVADVNFDPARLHGFPSSRTNFGEPS
jgi:hypothetical protein